MNVHIYIYILQHVYLKKKTHNYYILYSTLNNIKLKYIQNNR